MANLGTWRPVEANIVAQAIAETSTTQIQKLRDEIQAKDTGSNNLGEATFIYAKGVASTAVGDICAIEDDGTTTRAVASGNYKLLGIAMSANVANQYGWYLIVGKENGNVGTSFADNAQCYLSATAGRIDDTVVADDYIYDMKGAGAESSNLAALELNRPSTTNAGEASYSSLTVTTLSTTNIDAGASGTAGSVDVFPTTASKGKFTLSCDDQTGNTAVTMKPAAHGQATTVTIPDSGLATSYVAQSTAALTVGEVDVLDGATAGTQVANKAVIADANVNTGASKVTSLFIGASGSEVQLTATPAEINSVCDKSTSVVNVTDATVSLTAAAHAERIVTLSRAAGVTVTLPAATGTGNKYKIITATTVSSNNNIIQVANASDSYAGICLGVDTDGEGATGYTWNADSGDDTITMSGTATGGVAGDVWTITDYATNLFLVEGRITQSGGSEATPFSAAVS